MNNFEGSIYDQMRKNRWRTAYLLLIFPIIIIGLTYAGLLIYAQNTQGSTIEIANQMMRTVGFWVLIGVFIWSLISYTLGHKMILSYAHAKPIQKKDSPELYRVVENASITAGLPITPSIYIIEDQSLNAFATGTSPNKSMVAISRGLMEKLSKAELEAVMAHEIGHIINRDIRVMLISITLVGAIEMIGEILLRTGYARSSNSKNSNPLPLIGFLFITVGVLIATLTRFAISREREYLADSTSAHLTSNPNALASALEKIAADARLEVLDQKATMGGLCIADPSQKGHIQNTMNLGEEKSKITGFWTNLWSTHPPITDRIKRLRGY